MSKIELAGPKQQLSAVLSFLRESELLHVEPATYGFIEAADEAHVRSFIPDERSMSERIFLQELRDKCRRIFEFLPPAELRASYLYPQSIIDSVSGLIDRHIAECQTLHDRKEALQKKLEELGRFDPFLETLGGLLKDLSDSNEVDFIGVTVKDESAIELLKSHVKKLSRDEYDIASARARDGSIVGLIAAGRESCEKIRNSLGDVNIPEMTFPAEIGKLGFAEKLRFVKEKGTEVAGEIDEVDGRLRSFALRWGPIYKKVSDWISERLSVMNATSCAFETKMCFFIYGWVPSRQVSSLRNGLDEKFSGTVVVEEKEIREEDLDRIPVMLRNPAYFRPFELFTRLLPLPRYTSYDPTPFVAIFFPVFFGMILGDAGYGVILLALSLILVRRFRKKKNVADAGKILFASSLYAVFFGILYGELFGGLGHALIGLKPICIERRTAVIPMIVFSLSIGAVHVFIGFLLGIISAIRKKMKREAASRILSMVAVICLLGVIGSFFGLFPEIFTTPLLLVLLGLSPLVLLTGGILAPLEILKSIGNIISYVRIMAIGLTSVLLAFIANRLGGMTGDIMLGAVVAGLLHLLNIILGVFSPTIHSLRLHYVEFFGKFIESGGKSFEPMKKAG